LAVDKGTICRHWECFKAQKNIIQQPGRHSLLTTGEINDIIQMIIEARQDRRPLSGPEIRNIIERKYGKLLFLDTLYHIFKRDGRVKSCSAVPMEDSRRHVTEQTIRDSFGTLFQNVSGCPAHFVFNMDRTENVEGFEPNPRGRGFIVGIDVFNAFLERTELTMMIRGHEHCPNGFPWSFGNDGRLLTIFSVIDSCGKGNDGAVVIVNQSDVTIHTFKHRERARILVPYFILQSITNTFNDLTLPRSDNSSHRYIEIF
jgi:hypothetical protein